MTCNPHFDIGDKVRLRDGHGLQIVTQIDYPNSRMSTRYLTGKHYQFDRPMHHFVPADPRPPKPKAPKMKKRFSLIRSPECIGTYLATDSQGSFVLEIEADPPYVGTFARHHLQEVRPYSICLGGVHYEAPEGRFSVGDLLFLNGRVCAVTALDTKACQPIQFPAGMHRILTERIT